MRSDGFLYITYQHVIEMSVPYQFPDLSRSFAHCMYEPRRSQSRCINRQKRMRPISSHLGRTSLGNKGFIIWPSGKFFPQNTASRPERARSIDKIVPYLVRSGSQSQCRVRFILPAYRASHIIRFSSYITRLVHMLHDGETRMDAIV